MTPRDWGRAIGVGKAVDDPNTEKTRGLGSEREQRGIAVCLMEIHRIRTKASERVSGNAHFTPFISLFLSHRIDVTPDVAPFTLFFFFAATNTAEELQQNA